MLKAIKINDTEITKNTNKRGYSAKINIEFENNTNSNFYISKDTKKQLNVAIECLPNMLNKIILDPTLGMIYIKY